MPGPNSTVFGEINPCSILVFFLGGGSVFGFPTWAKICHEKGREPRITIFRVRWRLGSPNDLTKQGPSDAPQLFSAQDSDPAIASTRSAKALKWD